MTDTPHSRLVMAIYWMGETEFIAGMGTDRETAYESLMGNVLLDSWLKSHIHKNRDFVSYENVNPCSTGWTIATSSN